MNGTKEIMEFSSNPFDFSLNSKDFFKLAEKPTQKAKETKEVTAKEKKEKASAGKGTSGSDCDVSLPVTVLGRNILHVIDGTETVKLSVVYEKLLEEGYEQMKLSKFGLVYHESTRKVYIVEQSISGVSDDTCVDMTEGKKITIVDGMLKAEFSASDFEGIEPDEITAADVAEKFSLINSAYKGCGIYYEENCDVAYPVLEKVINGNLPGTIVINSNGNEKTYASDEVKTFKELAKKIVGDVGEVDVFLVKGEEKYFLTYGAGKAKPYCKKSKTTGKPSKKVEKKYQLPFALYVKTWGERYNLDSSMFEGKEKVTTEEVTQYMGTREGMFRDKERKPFYLFIEDQNLLSCDFMSGKKGAV